MGRLQNSAIGIPSCKGIFQLLSTAIKIPRNINIRPASDLALTLEDCLTILSDISQQPTSIYKLMSGDLYYIGLTDASALGAWGVWNSLTHYLPPIVCSTLFLAEVRNQLVSEK